MDLHEIFLASQLAGKNNGKAEIADLSDYYTKSQTDSRISEKVAEIVSNAPDDFNTLKEISDWIENHEDSAAAMNTAIAANTTAIDTKADKTTTYTKTEVNYALDNKVDKVLDKGLSTNDFTNADKTKLDSLNNYDDTEMKSEIAKTTEQLVLNRSTLGYQRKNLLMNELHEIGSVYTHNGVDWVANADGTVTVNGTANGGWSDYYLVGSLSSTTAVLPKGKYKVSCKGATINCKLRVFDRTTGENTLVCTVESDTTIEIDTAMTRVILSVVVDKTVSDLVLKPMIRPAEITDDTYEPYRPSVLEYIAGLEERINALELANQEEN